MRSEPLDGSDLVVSTVGLGCNNFGGRLDLERTREVVDAALDHNRTPRSQAETDHTFWTGTAEQIADTMLAYRAVGFGTFIVELPAPYDLETMETLTSVVKPMVDAA